MAKKHVQLLQFAKNYSKIIKTLRYISLSVEVHVEICLCGHIIMNTSEHSNYGQRRCQQGLLNLSLILWNTMKRICLI